HANRHVRGSLTLFGSLPKHRKPQTLVKSKQKYAFKMIHVVPRPNVLISRPVAMERLAPRPNRLIGFCQFQKRVATRRCFIGLRLCDKLLKRLSRFSIAQSHLRKLWLVFFPQRFLGRLTPEYLLEPRHSPLHSPLASPIGDYPFKKDE